MNPYGCNKVLYDGIYLYSAHENRRLEIYVINELWYIIIFNIILIRIKCSILLNLLD